MSWFTNRAIFSYIFTYLMYPFFEWTPAEGHIPLTQFPLPHLVLQYRKDHSLHLPISSLECLCYWLVLNLVLLSLFNAFQYLTFCHVDLFTHTSHFSTFNLSSTTSRVGQEFELISWLHHSQVVVGIKSFTMVAFP